MDHKKLTKFMGSYVLGDANLFFIRNRNEQRVLDAIPRILEKIPDYLPDDIDLQDIYALSLNSLPARYVQQGSIVLRESVGQIDVDDAVRDAVKTVRERPNYPTE